MIIILNSNITHKKNLFFNFILLVHIFLMVFIRINSLIHYNSKIVCLVSNIKFVSNYMVFKINFNINKTYFH